MYQTILQFKKKDKFNLHFCSMGISVQSICNFKIIEPVNWLALNRIQMIVAVPQLWLIPVFDDNILLK